MTSLEEILKEEMKDTEFARLYEEALIQTQKEIDRQLSSPFRIFWRLWYNLL